MTYFKEAKDKNDAVSMYNLSHILIYHDELNKGIDERINDSIDLLINSSIQEFSPSDNLLCIALIKKHGFDLSKIKENLLEKEPKKK